MIKLLKIKMGFRNQVTPSHQPSDDRYAVLLYKPFAVQSWGGGIRSTRLSDKQVALTSHPGSNLSAKSGFPGPSAHIAGE